MRFLLTFFLMLVQTVSAQQADSVRIVLGKFDPETDEAFVEVPATAASRSGMYLRRETWLAFKAMKEAAAKDGISLTIISATRDFNHQKRIWEAKWTGARKVNGQDLSRSVSDEAERARTILKYSSMPGTSRHHWGTDLDINSLNPSYFLTGKGKSEYDWLREHAATFGFCQVYTAKGSDRQDGYEEEHWHWSYLPLAHAMLEFYRLHIGPEQLVGFEGHDAIGFEEKMRYVFGISKACRK